MLIGVLLPASRGDAHEGRECRAPLQPHARAVLEVCCDEQREVGAPLEGVEFGRHVERRANRDDDPADFERIDCRQRSRERLAVEGCVVTEEPWEDELAHLLPQGQRRQ
jgi:hypothetical protein